MYLLLKPLTHHLTKDSITLNRKNKNINVINKEIKNLDQFKNEIVIVATGPLTSKNLSNNIKEKTSETSLAFYDAIAPIVYKDSVGRTCIKLKLRKGII